MSNSKDNLKEKQNFDFSDIYNSYDNNTTASEESNNKQDKVDNDINSKKLKHELIKQNSKYMVCTWYTDAKCNNIFVTNTEYFKEQYLQWHMERIDHKKVVYTHNKDQHNLAAHIYEDLCYLVELQIQNTNNNILPSSTSLLNLSVLTTTTQSSRSEYSSYINDYADKQFITAIARIIEEATLNELQTGLKARLLFLTKHYCINHCLALASKNVAEQTPYFETYDEIIRQLYITNLYQIINSVIGALLEDLQKADILLQLHRLSLVFQADYVSVSEITMQVNTIIESITTDFI
ncbi:19648_t:CDS:2, partial [Racocetra persica]